MVTSLVTPLGAELESMAAVEITNGLAGIAKALDFLHTEVRLDSCIIVDVEVPKINMDRR